MPSIASSRLLTEQRRSPARHRRPVARLRITWHSDSTFTMRFSSAVRWVREQACLSANQVAGKLHLLLADYLAFESATILPANLMMPFALVTNIEITTIFEHAESLRDPYSLESSLQANTDLAELWRCASPSLIHRLLN